MLGKAALATAACRFFGLSPSTSQRVGLTLSQGGEFAFVAFRTARNAGILDDTTTQLLLTCVSLTMALTPLAEDVGAKRAIVMQKNEGNKKKE
jgi:CPA2 family monovalent cation:H+ antiporter-2